MGARSCSGKRDLVGTDLLDGDRFEPELQRERVFAQAVVVLGRIHEERADRRNDGMLGGY
ncbi:MAG: hypothetical protein GXY83_31405 [Rhodopirellula sp.]|nr:hypothetical protein [Rhodopirellula sp.]